MKIDYNNEGKVDRKFSPDWWFNHLRSSQRSMIEYIEQLHEEIDRLNEQLKSKNK